MSRSARAALLVAAALLAAVPAAAGVAKRKPSPPRAPKPPAGAALAALSAPPVRTSLASQRIYFVLTDRYRNGDPSNDRGGATGGRDVTGYDPADPAYFHGGDFRGLTGDCADPRTGLARVKALGFTAVWVTPPVKQKATQGPSAAYHGYWGLDFTTVDPHLGADADFAAFVACAHSLGLKVILDVVVNHTADVIRLSDYRYVGPGERPYRDCSGKAFDPAAFVRKPFPCLSPAAMPRTPSVPEPERDAKRPAWLNDVTRYHDRGDIDFSNCDAACYEQGDFFGLDDLFTEQPSVVDGLAEMHADWIRRYKVDGFRVDTARHVNKAFFGLWVPKVMAAAREAGVADFQIFGEVFLRDSTELARYVRERGLPNVLDFPLQDALVRFAGGSASAKGIVARLGDDDYFAGPDGVAPVPPTFLGNHDMGRAAQQIRDQSHAGGEQLLRRVLLGHDLLYLLRGAPTVLYGDEVGMMGRGGDQQTRQDMFPTGVVEWQEQERAGSPPIGTGSSFDVESPVAAHLRELGRLRDEVPALSNGATVVRRAQGSVLAVSRVDAAARREVVAVFNAGTAATRVSVPTSTPSADWTPLLGGGGPVRSAAGGALTVEVPALGTVLLRAGADLPARKPPRPALRIGADELTSLRLVRATVPGPPVSVAFAVKRGTGPWRRLAVDDSPPYRAFVDPRSFKRKQRAWVVAVARGLDGSVTVSKVMGTIPRR